MIPSGLPDPNVLPQNTAVKYIDENEQVSYWKVLADAQVGIYLPLYKTGASKSLIFSFAMEDTLTAGNRIKSTEGSFFENLFGGPLHTKKAVPYTDKNGRLNEVNIKLINYLNPQWLLNGGPGLDFDRYRDDGKNAPAVVLNYMNRGGNMKTYSNGDYKLFKDLAERLAMTKQLQFLGYKKKIIVGNEWARLNNLIIDLEGPNLYLYTSNSKYGLFEDKKVKQTATRVGLFINHSDVINRKIVLNANGISAVTNKSSWAIGDQSRNLWLAVNQVDGDITVLSFKATKKQPGTIMN